MINQSRVVAIIPARGGSKGLPGKNIRSLCSKPLIAWTIEVAKKSKYIDMILCTTDSAEIKNVAESYGAEAPFLRPIELAADTTPTIDVVFHALEYIKVVQNKEFDYVILLEPTSPLREYDDIDRMLEILEEKKNKFDAIVSLGEVSQSPSILKRIFDDEIEPFCHELPKTTRRQDNEPAYFPYGVAYVVKKTVLMREKSFYPERCTSFIIKRYQCYEIDDIYDFICVENIMKYEWGLT